MFKSIFSTATWKQSQITILGTLINGGLGLLFYILMAKFLGLSNFGLLTVSIASLTLIADIVEFGTNTGLVRYVASSYEINKERALRFLKLGLEFKIIIWLGVLLVGILVSPYIAKDVFKKVELITPLRLAMIGVGGAMFLSFATSSLQALQRYFIWSVVNISTNLLRLIIILVLFYIGELNLFSGLLSYIILPFFGFSLALLFLPTKQILNTYGEFRVAKEFFKYNLWIGMFTIIAALSSRLDTFLSARFLSSSELGTYGLANQLVQVVPQLVGALGVVASPKFASFTKKSDMITYFKKFQLFVLGISILGLIAIPIANFLIPIFLPEYQSAMGPFIILLIAMLVFLISIPLHNSILYYYGNSRLFFWISIFHLFIIGGVGYILIPLYGVTGAATTVLIGTSLNFLIPLVWFLIRLRR